ncbi:unnamed protein product [Lymnaea stagnalis]|uniref:Uncharacterized protein n=1 Tax=Lymnaea stagnalis TaxID=6523 RepID=A0AAV2I6M7_LYMST
MALRKGPSQVAGRLGPLILKETSNSFTSTAIARNSNSNEEKDIMRNSSKTKIDAYDLLLVKGSFEIPVHKSESIKKYQSYFDSGYVLHLRKRNAERQSNVG